MALLDNHGRLFRKISIIDILAIIILLGIIYIGLSFFLKPEILVPVEVELCNERPNSWTLPVCGASKDFILNSVKVGDVIVNHNNKIIGKITEVTYSSARNTYTNPLTGNVEEVYPTRTKDIHLQLELLAKKGAKQIEFENNLLEIGSFIKLNLPHTTINSRVIKMFDLSRVIIEKNATIKILNVYPWVADALSIDSIMKDQNGRVVAKVIGKEVKPARIITTSDRGDVYSREDPLKKDVTLQILLSLESKSDGLYLFSTKVFIGGDIILSFENVDVRGNIAAID